MKLVIPDNNDVELFKVIKGLKEKKFKHQISAIYGKPTESKYLGTGRANIFFDDITKEEMNKRVLAFQEIGIDYNYAINGIIPRARFNENRKQIIEELEWIESSSIKQITVANYELARLAQKYSPSVNINVSIFAEVDNEKKIEQWCNIPNVKTIIADRSTYRQLTYLEKLVLKAKQLGRSISLVANLGCMSGCMRTVEHALIKDLASIDRNSLHYAPCSFYCMKYLLANPKEFLKLPVIRPEDLDIYESIGIEYIKLVDRTQHTSWIKNVVEHYLKGTFDGNILELTCNFTRSESNEMTNEQVASIDMDKIIKSRTDVIEYRKMLPELMKVSISKDYNFLACDNNCENCKTGCMDESFINYDPQRRKIVLKQLDTLENDYLFK
jgi:collagenase-like PrtC family protease